MPRGIGGEDGPSLWTFLCIILVWAWLKQAAKDTKKKVEDTLEIGQNSGGPLQSETTKEIASLQSFVDRIPVAPTKLKFKLPHYKSIADDTWSELISVVNIDEGKLFAMVEKLTVFELRAVAKQFGLKEPTVLGLTTHTLTIFKAYEWKLSDGMFGNDLTRMRQIWAKTGLWV